MPSDSFRYDEGGSVRPKGSNKGSGTGSVIDPRAKYPSSHTFVSDGPAKYEKDMRRRPGGSLRKGHPFKSTACTCSGHPCKCGTHEAEKHKIHC